MKKIKYLKITDNKLNLLLYIQILVDQSHIKHIYSIIFQMKPFYKNMDSTKLKL